MIDLSVVIVNYNARHFLQICLDALQVALDGINAETIVIDNISTDDSCAVIKSQYTWVTLIENNENVGFGRANNQGFDIAKGKNILILNPDTIVQKSTLLESLELIKNDSKVGAVGVRMLDGSGNFLPESKRGLPTPQTAFYKAFGLSSLFPKSERYARYYLGHLPEAKTTEIEVLAGAYMMCSAHILKECAGFDEDFFMYGEDIDLSYRITQKGYKNIYLATAPIIHFKGESAGRDAVWAQRFYDAMYLFSEKHFSENGKLYNYLINCGIKFKKIISTSKKISTTKTDLSNLQLTIVSNTEAKGYDEFSKSFKNVEYHNDVQGISIASSAMLFLPDVDKKFIIETMDKYKSEKQYFFASADGSFVLSSPSSTSQGEIWQIKNK